MLTSSRSLIAETRDSQLQGKDERWVRGTLTLFEAHKDFVLGSRVLHGDETTVALLNPGAGKTKTAYMWAYARGVFDPQPGVAYDFCTGRGSEFPFEFLSGWTGTLVRDGYVGYEKALLLDGRFDAGCMAHSRRKFDELVKANASDVAAQAIQRIAWLYRIEADARDLTAEQRLKMRQDRSRPLCDELHTWLKLQRQRVPDGSGIAKAIDYSLNALTRFLFDGDVPIDNNHLENQMRPRCAPGPWVGVMRSPLLCEVAQGGCAGRL